MSLYVKNVKSIIPIEGEKFKIQYNINPTKQCFLRHILCFPNYINEEKIGRTEMALRKEERETST